jgi:D-ribose pyranase
VKKQGILNHRLADVIAMMGHTDMLVVADAGLPVPPGVERIDLAVEAGMPGMLAVVRAIAAELQVEQITYASELEASNPALAADLRATYPKAVSFHVPHTELKAMTARARAVVRTGECTPYANVILFSGVTF